MGTKIKIALFLFLTFFHVGTLNTVYAATKEQDGLKISYTSDKNAYSENENIETTLTVTNVSDDKVNNIIIKSFAPSNYTLQKESEYEKIIDSLNSGESVSIQSNYIKSNIVKETTVSDVNKSITNSSITNSANKKTQNQELKTKSNNGATTNDTNNFFAIILIMSVGLALLIAGKHRKKTAISIFLCCLILNFLSYQQKVSAINLQNTIDISQEITVEHNKLSLNAQVVYDTRNVNINDTYTDIDSDNDGLSDIDEAKWKTDINNTDTDGDGISDYEEVILGTDPLVFNNYNEKNDSDSDGLKDLDEIRTYKTDPYNIDTDDDGLSDYDEINVHHTNPLLPDTDDDTLTDGFEIMHSLNPNNQISDGVTKDNERIIEQTINDKCISSKLRSATNIAQPNIFGEVSGEIDKNVFLSESTESSLDDLRAILGEPVLISGDDSYVNGLNLSFTLTTENKDATIVKINEDGSFEPMQSKIEDNVISCKLNCSGTYSLIDVTEFLDEVGINLSAYWDDDETEMNDSFVVATSNDKNNNQYKDEPYNANIEPTELFKLNNVNSKNVNTDVAGQADITFVIDTTGSMSSAINNVVTNINSFANVLANNYNVKINYSLVEFKDIEDDSADSTKVIGNGSSNWFSDTASFTQKVNELSVGGGGDTPESDIDALETARRLDYRTSVNKFIILITDAPYKTGNNYNIDSLEDEISLLKKDNITTSVVTQSWLKDTYQSLFEGTGGIYADIDDNFSSTLLSLADMIGQTTSDGTWVILKHGYKYVKVNDEKDQDGDGIPTTEELGEKEEVDITPFIKLQLNAHGVQLDKYIGKTKINVYNASSDPTANDSDNDGILDSDDDAPWIKGYADGSIGEVNLLAVPGDGVSTILLTQNTGHSFIVYKSYVKDSFDLSLWNGGYTTKSGSWKDAIANKTHTDNYVLNANDVFAFSAGGDENFSASCAIYNMEFYKHFNPAYNYSYTPNCYYTKKVTQSQLDKMLNTMNKESTKKYNIITHTCTHVSLNVWNTMYNTNINPIGLNTPKNLYSWLNKHKGKNDFDLNDVIN